MADKISEISKKTRKKLIEKNNTNYISSKKKTKTKKQETNSR